jgi:hypothetical protein
VRVLGSVLPGATPEPCANDGGEAMLTACGVGMARLPGYS